MRSPRLWIFFVGSAIVLLLILWLVLSLAELYRTIAQVSAPWLATVTLVGILLLLVVLLAAFLYFLFGVWRGRRRKQDQRKTVTLPESKTEAVSENLKSIRKQVSQLQDEVARQALMTKSQSLESSIEHPDLKIVVFGAGAAGKGCLATLGPAGG